ncbi:MAG TPA: GNAT family N-acetyltransferase [Vicinamibacterales bacterium]
MARAVRTYLEMTDPLDLTGDSAALPDVRVERDTVCNPGEWRRLYTDVGREYHWTDRLPWTDEDIARYLSDPAVELWILREAGETAGYFELRREPDRAVEIAYFGLLPAFIGRGLGKYLLTAAVKRAWDLGATRVWVHTSSLDHTSALSNYLSRGFSIWKQEVYDVDIC